MVQTPDTNLSRCASNRVSEAKMKLSGLIEKVQSTDAEVVITKNGRAAAVLVSPDEFDGWRETIAIKADGDLMSEIEKSIAAQKKKPKVHTSEEFFE
jgi:prevent-host-death family protein